MGRYMVTAIALLSLIAITVTAQQYQYDHKLRPRKAPAREVGPWADDVRQDFKRANRAAGSPRILILYGEEPIQNMGGFELSAIQSAEISGESDTSLDAQVVLDVNEATSSSRGSGNIDGNARQRSHVILSFKDFIPTEPDEWTPEKIGGFERRVLENAIAGTLLDAGAVLVDRKTALEFHADDIFSAMKQDRLEAQRDALKKCTDIIITIQVGRSEKEIIRVSGDETVSIPRLSARLVSVAEVRLIDVILAGAVSRTMHNANLETTNIDEHADTLALIVLDRLTEFWNQEEL